MDAPFGFAGVPTGQQGPAASGADFAVPDAGNEAQAYVFDENDPKLPQDVAFFPSMRDGSSPLAFAAQPQAQQPATAPISTDAPATASVAPTEQTAVAPEQQQAAVAAVPPAPSQDVAESTEPQQVATQFLENSNAQPQQVAVADAEAPKKRNFLSSFFGANRAAAAPSPIIAAATAKAAVVESEARQAAVQPLIATDAPARPLIQASTRAPVSASALPGVREGSLFEISRRSGLDDESDVDLHEDIGSYQVASAAGLARLAPNGLHLQHQDVDVACLKPSLVRVLRTAEQHFGRKVLVTSGYRSADRNKRARGARNSLHMYCAAADVQIEGVSKVQLASFFRSMPGRGGVGTYCHTDSVHVDVGPERDWNWRCRRRR